MTEKKALILLLIGMSLLTVVATAILVATEASGTAYGLVTGLLAALGGYLSSVVVMHYGKLEERREREEILLSR